MRAQRRRPIRPPCDNRAGGSGHRTISRSELMSIVIRDCARRAGFSPSPEQQRRTGDLRWIGRVHRFSSRPNIPLAERDGTDGPGRLRRPKRNTTAALAGRERYPQYLHRRIVCQRRRGRRHRPRRLRDVRARDSGTRSGLRGVSGPRADQALLLNGASVSRRGPERGRCRRARQHADEGGVHYAWCAKPTAMTARPAWTRSRAIDADVDVGRNMIGWA